MNPKERFSTVTRVPKTYRYYNLHTCIVHYRCSIFVF